MKINIIFLFIVCFLTKGHATNGYDLWLSYKKVTNNTLLKEYREILTGTCVLGDSETIKVTREELKRGLDGLLDMQLEISVEQQKSTSFMVAQKKDLPLAVLQKLSKEFDLIGEEGFIVKEIQLNRKKILVITGLKDVGVLYGVFKFLRLLQTHQTIQGIHMVDSPKIDLRMLNHWDNLDGTVERGFAGFSLWNWQKLPGYIDQRYVDYARANASIGINGVVLNNVNAHSLILTPMYLKKVKALASVFEPYGIKVYLSAKFSAPMQIGTLKTADPLASEVVEWWQVKTKEIYQYIPNFGGFLVKANSEGQPGPQDYGRSHADGANMLAAALAPYNGVVIWRAFVYSEHNDTDRAKQAFDEFVPLDGEFSDNVLIQTKNGPIDFQPREPFHPMFGAMPKTSLMMEFQITQEYLGFSTHLVFLPKLYEEVLAADTFRRGVNSTIAKVVDGTLHAKKITGMAGVANIGSDMNWTGHPFGQANWYGFGRLAWDPYLKAEIIAEEWIRCTYSNNISFVTPIKEMMLDSREAVVNYMMPLGLHHLFDTGHHYGPGPWVDNLSRPEWNPVYYHNAETQGIGFDRTFTGSNATSQYAPEVARMFENVDTCPEEFLLWFHHLPWDYKMKNGRQLWDEMAFKYQEGVQQVEQMIAVWEASKNYITITQYQEVHMLLNIQLEEAKWWRDASLLYFKTFSKKELPKGVGLPTESLDYFKALKFPFAPGIRAQWD